MNTTKKITHQYPTSAALVAFHTKMDVCAVRMPSGQDALFIGGVFKKCSFPVAAVVELCRMSITEARSALRAGFPGW